MIEDLYFLFRILVFPGFIFAASLGLLYLGVDRKINARLQNRIGPPIWQQFLDFFKLMSKETIKPELASAWFFFAPAVALASLLVLAHSFPIHGATIYPILGNLIFVLYLLLLSTVFTALAGFSSSNPFGIIGAMRKITQTIAVEFPLIVAIFVSAIAACSYNITTISAHQFANGYLALTYPLAAIAFIIAAIGDLHKTPFDIPDAKQELVAGLYTEFSGATYAIFELVHAVKFYVLATLAVFLFFGGAETIWLFLIKFFAIGILITLIRTILARLRIGQTLKFFWLLIGPLAVIDLIRVMLL